MDSRRAPRRPVCPGPGPGDGGEWPPPACRTATGQGPAAPPWRAREGRSGCNHYLPYDQPYGPEARAFAQGAFAAATEVELLRSPKLDPYDRTLAYVFVNGRNYSVLAIRAGYTTETVSHYGDNGLPRDAAEVVAAAKSAPPLPFEPPHQYRARMCTLTESLKSQGAYPRN